MYPNGYNKLRDLVEGNRRTKLFPVAVALWIVAGLGNWLFQKLNQPILAYASLICGVVGFLLGLWVMVQSTGMAQKRGTAGQLGHIFKVIFIAGLILIAASITLFLVAKATGLYHPEPAPIEYQSN